MTDLHLIVANGMFKYFTNAFRYAPNCNYKEEQCNQDQAQILFVKKLCIRWNLTKPSV